MTYNIFFCVFILFSIFTYMMLLNGKISVKHKRLLLLIFVVSSSFFVSFKPMEVKDTARYLEVFGSNHSLQYIINNYDVRYGNRYMGLDIGFVLYMFFIKGLGITFRGFVFVNSIISLTIFIVGINSLCNEKKTKVNVDILRVAMLFMIMYGFHYSAIVLRGGLSIGLGICAVAESMKKKKKLWLIILLLALSMSVQSMGLLNIIPVFICMRDIRISRKNAMIVLTFVFVWFLFNIGSIVTPVIAQLLLRFLSWSPLVGFSTKVNDADYRVGLRDWLMWIISVILIYFSEDKNNRKMNLKMSMTCGMVLLCFGYPFRAFSRVVDYLFVYSVPVIYVNMEEHKRNSVTRYAALLATLGMIAIQVVAIY